ncbi:hypothetical protein [Lysobacter soli]|uniref:hypothetical protein n=1 Tax=Lysobacter soli TaxID=453783 RepID=UPI0024107F8A|nr:hypothetical protein [Lysobacter soli]MDG2518090.1 hypothetical protein [Lysobacter soli]
MSRKLAITDRLRDRGFVDQWGFVAFAGVGFAAIVSAKALRIEGVIVAVGAVAAMMAYAVIIGRAGTGRLRADQGGDNCYYLGLIYTLASLCYAIATFDPSDTASTIVQGFGVALATTIVGLILRVFFSQGRPDLENVEEQSRIDLTDAVVRLKGELGDVVRQLNDFSRIVQQSMTELQKSATDNIQSFASGTVGELSGVVEAATSTIRNEANDFAARSKRYSTTFDKLLAKLDQHADGVELMKAGQEAMQITAQSAESAAMAAAAAVAALRDGADGARAAAMSTQDAVSAVQQLVIGLSACVDDIRSSMKEVHEESSKRLEELRSGPAVSVVEVVNTLQHAAEALRAHIADSANLHASVHASMSAQSEAALETSRRFNEQLQQELDRSRVLVGTVHSSLADMTSKLVEAVEATA